MPTTRTASKTRRPDMRDYFRACIEREVSGMFSRVDVSRRLPPGVRRVDGAVTDRTITVTMDDGTKFEWTGGRYASRKVNLCYAPLMPKPVTA
jgi:hypothetical protein